MDATVFRILFVKYFENNVPLSFLFTFMNYFVLLYDTKLQHIRSDYSTFKSEYENMKRFKGYRYFCKA